MSILSKTYGMTMAKVKEVIINLVQKMKPTWNSHEVLSCFPRLPILKSKPS